MESELKKRIDELEKQKLSLIEKAKELDGTLRYKGYEAKALREVLSNERGNEYRMLKRRLDELEFQIATESLNLQSERKMMKEIRETQKQLERATEVEKKRRKLFLVEGDLKQLAEERTRVENEIQRVKNEIKSLKDELNEKSKEAREAVRRDRRRKEMEDQRKKLMSDLGIKDQPFEGEVSLGEIAVIRKKNG